MEQKQECPHSMNLVISYSNLTYKFKLEVFECTKCGAVHKHLVDLP